MHIEKTAFSWEERQSWQASLGRKLVGLYLTCTPLKRLFAVICKINRGRKLIFKWLLHKPQIKVKRNSIHLETITDKVLNFELISLACLSVSIQLRGWKISLLFLPADI